MHKKIALFSIKPSYVEKIFNKEKRYEYRKVKCKESIDRILIYATFPVKKIVGYVDILDILEDSPTAIWKETSLYAGIEKDAYEKYFFQATKAVAYKIGEVHKFEKSILLSEIGLSRAPQSFCYIDMIELEINNEANL